MVRDALNVRPFRRPRKSSPDRPLQPPETTGAGEPPTVDLRLAHLPRNDLGNAERLITRYGKDLMYVADGGAIGWYAWDEQLGHWSRELGEMRSQMMAQETAKAIRSEARALDQGGPGKDESKLDHTDRVDGLYKFATGSGNAGRLEAMLRTAQPQLTRRGRDLDADARLLNLANGTMDLGINLDVGGELACRKPERGDLISRRASTVWDPNAQAPRFLAFLEEILPDPEVRLFLQRFFGYCLTGEIGEQCMLLFYGRGANGKSTLLNVIRAVLGDYVAGVPVTSLLDARAGKGGEPSPDLARLPGARLVLASEPERKSRLSSAMIKQLTGGEPITVRPLWGEFFEFTPQFKLVLTFNARPIVPADDDGMWRRLLMVGFDVKITKPVAHYHDVLLEEASGILNWMLDGYLMWRERGLAAPEQVRSLTEEYRRDSDPIGQFLEHCIVLENTPLADDGTRSAEVFECYEAWCLENAMRPVSPNGFGRAMTERGYQRTKSSTIRYVGLSLTSTGCDLLANLRKRRETERRKGDMPVPSQPAGGE
jgi:putative DNA primase/helicase